MPTPPVATQPCGSERQQGPESLAASSNQMRRQLRDQGDRALHPRHNQAVASFQIILDKRRQRGQGIFPPAPILIRDLLRRQIHFVSP